ncbi:hypothetical protein V6N12_024692 [Hibiscus sabdariffa]|uniref:Uncharacterized protein n=1 Tax=Hibiscus sabdariffa TaxID=183260 RepID=A0ABR2BFC0_9ROSI
MYLIDDVASDASSSSLATLLRLDFILLAINGWHTSIFPYRLRFAPLPLDPPLIVVLHFPFCTILFSAASDLPSVLSSIPSMASGHFLGSLYITLGFCFGIPCLPNSTFNHSPN